MRTLIICAAAALTLAACQRPAENTETPMAEDAAMDAAPAADAATTGPATAPSGAGSSAAAAGDAAADTAGSAPVDDGAPAPSSSPVRQETRDAAKEKAEATNLHPKT